ncbi:WD40 repeat domain-containing protein [Gordonia westfalica]|uniref:WD40 repeat domain-containing protein n=1 Tax=Gordonia westfalica TaxID=158898 RepID=A0ABU2GYJ4_9ACTN|nr:WD40 repeat domain-containing protein [Gordonia westfalica]MDS1116014.1 WD40 repeat domain-containing protein [Gordonia westfalica]
MDEIGERTLVIGSGADITALGTIVTILQERGVYAIPATSLAEVAAPNAAIVAISPALIADRELLDTLRSWDGTRLVPVRVAPVGAGEVPAFLRELNWILWDTADIGARNSSLLTALHFDLGRYRDAQGLEAQAAAWVAADRDPHYLIADRKAIADGTPAGASAQLAEYLAASERASRREWWKRNGRWVFRGVALLGVIAIAVTGWRTVENLKSANTLAGTLLSVDDSADRADLQALKLGGLIDQQAANGRAVPDSTYGVLMQAMSHPWDLGVLGYTRNAAINGFVVGDDPTVAISADGEGTLVRWDLSTGAMTDRRRLTDSSLYLVDATPDGRIAATYAADNTLRITEVSSGATVNAPASNVAHLQISDSGTTMAYHGSETLTRLTVPSGARQPVTRMVGSYDAVYDLQGGPGDTVWALAEEDGDLVAINAASGAVAHRSALPTGKIYDAAISPSGKQLVAVGDDGQLWMAPVGGRFTPTGLAAPRSVSTLVLDNRGRVLLSAPVSGPQVVDTVDGATSRVCGSVSTVDDFSLSTDGNSVICSARGVGVLADLTEVTSAPRPPALNVQSSRSAAAGLASVRLADDGVVHVVNGSTRVDLRPSSTSVVAQSGQALPWIPGTIFGEGRPTAVALTPDGSTVAIGTSAGVVTEIDLPADGSIAFAGRWRPHNRPITSIAWQGTNQLWTEAHNGTWWRGPSCAGCGTSIDVLFQRIRDRQWVCYPAETRDIFTDRTRSTFALKPCADPIEATS